MIYGSSHFLPMEALLPLRLSCARGAFHRSRQHPFPTHTLLRLSLTSSKLSSALRASNPPAELNWDGGEVDVIGIGSKKDAIIDFCLESASASTSRLRFWTIQSRDSSKVQLLHKSSDMDSIIVDCSLRFSSCCPGIILVASAGHGPDDATALELLNSVKSAGGLSVTILLKPFCFEGQRRQQEVDNLMNKLQNNSQLYIVVETDALLKTKEATLAQAVKTVNYVVFLTINLVYVLITDKKGKFIQEPHEQVKELGSQEMLKLIGNFGESRVCYGTGNDIRSSVMQALLNAPFLKNDFKEANGLVILSITSAMAIDEHELRKVVVTFRQMTECKRKIIFFGACQADIEQHVVIATLLVVGVRMQKATAERGILSGLFEALPSLLSFVWRSSEVSAGASVDRQSHSISPDDEKFSDLNDNFTSSNILGLQFEDLVTEKTHRITGTDEANDASFYVANDDSHVHEENALSEGQLDRWILGPGFDIALKWAKERETLSGTTIMLEGIEIFTLPVGIKLSRKCYDGYDLLESGNPVTLENTSGKTVDDLSYQAKEVIDNPNLEPLSNDCSPGLLLSRGKDMLSKKPGMLSIRAASMLEAERECEKKWSPFVEMEYRGGLYRGRCQGGLPEGKGCITFDDGSFYDGMWQYGKRSGSGRFCYSNGDMYQGLWRDDLMHGKGWFYFHTGDRWFANFWKGKASGEGRFYSKSGSVFFGHFRNGWRHGKGLYIDANGSRWSELWEEGIPIRRTGLD